MSAVAMRRLATGLDFGEGLRWRDGELWYSDFYRHRISSVTMDGAVTVRHDAIGDQPSGLGWMPDGSLLVVAMSSRQVWRHDGERFQVHADLTAIATGPCNDMVVAPDGSAYVGNFGYDPAVDDTPAPARLALIRPDGSVETAATELAFPNGSVITPDGRTLIVAETFGSGFVAFSIGADGELTEGRRWADVPDTAPDGCCLDVEGALWFADARGERVVRVREGGEVLATIPTPQPAFACMLGGPEGRHLFIACAPGPFPADVAGLAAGEIWVVEVDVAHAGAP